eukprot:UN02039
MSGVKNLSSTMNLTMRTPGDAPPQINKKAEGHVDNNSYGEAPPTPSAIMPEQVHHKRPHMTGNRAARRFSEVAVQEDLDGVVSQPIPEEQTTEQQQDVSTNNVESPLNETSQPVAVVQPVVDTPKPVEQAQDVPKSAVIVDEEKPQQQKEEQKTEKTETTKPSWFNTKWSSKPKTTEQKPVVDEQTTTTPITSPKIQIADEDKEEYEAIEDDIPPPQYSYLSTISTAIWNSANYVASFIYKTEEPKQASTTKKDNDDDEKQQENTTTKTDDQTQIEDNVKQNEEQKQIQDTVVQPEPIAVQ